MNSPLKISCTTDDQTLQIHLGMHHGGGQGAHASKLTRIGGDFVDIWTILLTGGSPRTSAVAVHIQLGLHGHGKRARLLAALLNGRAMRGMGPSQGVCVSSKHAAAPGSVRIARYVSWHAYAAWRKRASARAEREPCFSRKGRFSPVLYQGGPTPVFPSA